MMPASIEIKAEFQLRQDFSFGNDVLGNIVWWRGVFRGHAELAPQARQFLPHTQRKGEQRFSPSR
jgi:hypothetical protein